MLTDERASVHISNIGPQNASSFLSIIKTLTKHFKLTLRRAISGMEHYTRTPTSYFPDVGKANGCWIWNFLRV
jgi:hypothetical protein